VTKAPPPLPPVPPLGLAVGVAAGVGMNHRPCCSLRAAPGMTPERQNRAVPSLRREVAAGLRQAWVTALVTSVMDLHVRIALPGSRAAKSDA